LTELSSTTRAKIPLYLLFTSARSHSSYLWINQLFETNESLDATLPREHFRNAQLGIRLAIRPTCFSSTPAQGNTRAIALQIAKFKPESTCVISVAEHWSPKASISKFTQLIPTAFGTERCVAVHFNVSGHADLTLFNSFCHSLLHFGEVRDWETGECAYVKGFDWVWYLYYELGTALDSMYGNASTTKLVKQLVPALRFGNNLRQSLKKFV